jgi:ankyrin repeat protein
MPLGTGEDLDSKNLKPLVALLQTGRPCILYLHGTPGSGKTTLSSFLMRKLRSPEYGNFKILAGFFCNDADTDRKDIPSLLRSLTHQLLSQCPPLFRQVKGLYHLLHEQATWTEDELWGFFRSIITFPSQDRIVCIINAVEDLGSSRTRLLENLIDCAKVSDAPFNVIITSRISLENDIKHESIQAIHLDDQPGKKEAIRSFIENEANRLSLERPSFLCHEDEIIAGLSKSDASYLRTTLAVARLRGLRQSTPMDVRVTLRSMPENIEGIYEQIIENIPVVPFAWPRMALCWILYSLRPLKTRELAVALALVACGETSSSIDDYISGDITRDLRVALGPLARVENDEVYLVHSSARDFLLSRKPRNDKDIYTFGPGTHLSLCQFCLSYLSKLDLDDGPFINSTSDPPYLDLPPETKYVFLPYAVQYWPDHFIQAEPRDSCSTILNFLDHDKLLQFWAKLYGCICSTSQRGRSPRTSKLDVAASFGLTDIVSNLLTNDLNQDKDPYQLGMALDLAVEKGHLEIVDQLLNARAVGKDTACIAARTGHVEVLKRLLRENPDYGVEDEAGCTLLHSAARRGHLSIAKWLLKKGADVTAADTQGNTPLHHAAAGGHVKVLDCLLQLKVSPDFTDGQGRTPLYRAAEYGHTQVAERLVDAKANIRLPNTEEATPLHAAAEGGHAKLLKLLIQKGANRMTFNKEGCTPLHLAAREGYASVVKELLRDSDVSQYFKTTSTPLHLAAQEGHAEVVKTLLDAHPECDVLNSNQATPLHLAAARGHPKVIKTLLNANADRNLRDDDNLTPLHVAARNGHLSALELLINPQSLLEEGTKGPLYLAAEKGHALIVRVLQGSLGKSADPDEDKYLALGIAAQNGHESVVDELLKSVPVANLYRGSTLTPLHRAASRGHLAIVEKLIQAGADLDAVNIRRATPLHLAVKHVKVAKLLVEKGADLNRIDEEECTPLHHAAKEDVADVVELLLKKQANKDAITETAFTPLHLAAERGYVKVVRALLAAEVNLDPTNNASLTPLHLASENGHAEVVQALMEAGARKDPVDDSHSSPLHKAALNGHESVVAILLRQGVNINATNDDGHTPIYIAAFFGSVEVLEKLLQPEWKGDLDHKASNGWTALHAATDYFRATDLLIKAGANVSIANDYGSIPLILAAESGMTEVVRLHLDAGADPDSTNKTGSSALHRASQSGYLDIVSLLLEQGATVNKKKKNGVTPLIMAISNGHKDVVKTLIERDKDALTLQNGTFKSILGPAAMQDTPESREIIDYILESVDIGNYSDSGFDELRWAVEMGSHQIWERFKPLRNIDSFEEDSDKWTLNLAIYQSKDSFFDEDILERHPSSFLVNPLLPGSLVLPPIWKELENTAGQLEISADGKEVAYKGKSSLLLSIYAFKQHIRIHGYTSKGELRLTHALKPQDPVRRLRSGPITLFLHVTWV